MIRLDVGVGLFVFCCFIFLFFWTGSFADNRDIRNAALRGPERVNARTQPTAAANIAAPRMEIERALRNLEAHDKGPRGEVFFTRRTSGTQADTTWLLRLIKLVTPSSRAHPARPCI